jgi:HSP20 family molecular chaperone IbpA
LTTGLDNTTDQTHVVGTEIQPKEYITMIYIRNGRLSPPKSVGPVGYILSTTVPYDPWDLEEVKRRMAKKSAPSDDRIDIYTTLLGIKDSLVQPPKIRTKCSDDAQVMTIDLPGVDPDDIYVSVDTNRCNERVVKVQISENGDRQEESIEARIQDGYGPDVVASCKHGRLVITIAAEKKPEPVRVEIATD